MGAFAFYGISIPDSVDTTSSQVEVKQVYTDKSEVMKVLKEFKTARFKLFKTSGEAVQFSQSCLPTISLNTDMGPISSPKPSESCTFRSLTPQEEVKLRKAIEANPSDLEYITKCVESNPRYLVTASDTPTILQAGQRHNALHVCARHDKEQAGQIILNYVMGDLLARMYPGEGMEQNNRRREHLVDMYLNMPDKGGGDTPLHLAAKFGNLSMVRLLCSQHQTRLEVTNKHGEIPRDIVCSRQGGDKVKGDILSLLKGQLVIPVFKNEEIKQLGKPISLKEAAEFFESSGELSFSSLSSSHSPLNSPLARSPVCRSPLAYSPLARSPVVTRPRLSSSSPVVSPLVTISAVLGPLPPVQADSLYREWRAGKKERLADPQLGVERQGRGLAEKNSVPWSEFWPWLGGYVDLASKEGMVMLESYLVERTKQIRMETEKNRFRELEDGVLESTVGNMDDGPDDVFKDDLVELELAVNLPSSTPAKKNEWNRYRDPSKSNDSFDEDCMNNSADSNGNITDHGNESANKTPELLSPLSSLATDMGGLNLLSANPNSNMTSNNTLTTPPTVLAHSLSGNVINTLSQFCSVVVTLLCENLAESDPGLMAEQELCEWVRGVVSHWAVLRRQVNNWRSDPQDRYSGLDWGQLAVRLVEMLGDQITLELGTGLDREICAQMLDRVAQIRTDKNRNSGIAGDTGLLGDFNRIREVTRSNSIEDLSWVKDIQRLSGLVSTYLLNDTLPSNNIGSVWDLDTEKDWVRTSNVNRARKFLHSTEAQGNCDEDFSDINGGRKQSLPLPAVRKLSVGSQDDSEWGTPPSSPAESIASMETCSEGVVAYVVGHRPSIQDRKVMEALEHLGESELSEYPAIQWYLTHLRGFTQRERMAWGEPGIMHEDTSCGLAKKLNLDITY